jgi:hypothetical protein
MLEDYHTRHRFRIRLGLHYIGFPELHPPWYNRIDDSRRNKNISGIKLRKLG